MKFSKLKHDVMQKVSTNKFVVGATTTALVLGSSIVAHAADATTVDFVGPMTTAVNSTVTNTIACFSAVIPIGLTIFTAKFCWMKGIQFFSKIASKG